MDLLGGYNSDEDASETSSLPAADESGDVAHQTTTTPHAVSAGLPASATESNSTRASRPVGDNNEAMADHSSSAAATRRGRKLLKLQAVLPAHIFDQLTRPELDDDDDEDEKVRTPAPSKAVARPKVPGKDEGLQSLLSNLPAAASSSLGNSDAALHGMKRAQHDEKHASSGSEPLGAAFLASTTTMTSRKRATPHDPARNTAIVRDIHAKGSATAASATAPVTFATSSKDAVPRRRVAAPDPPKVSVMSTSLAQNDAAYPLPGNGGVANTAVPDTNGDGAGTTMMLPRKRSRKELERALRQGNLDLVVDELPAVDLHHDASAYMVPTSSTNDVTTTAATAGQHRVKVVPVPMYDPSAGVASIGAASKGRGKNQIHHLMQSAAHLELERARAGSNHAHANNPHRANAKRKYGW